MKGPTIILDKEQAKRKMRRMALEIAERNMGEPALILIGIQENGYKIALRIGNLLKEFYPGIIQVTDLKINKKSPAEVFFDTAITINNKTIILIDDVANSGRTMIYAIQPLLKHLPGSLQTLALVQRTHKHFPVLIDYTGISVSTTPGENIEVIIKDDEVQEAVLQNENSIK